MPLRHEFIKTVDTRDIGSIRPVEIVDFQSNYKYANASSEMVDFLTMCKPTPTCFYIRNINVAAGEYWGDNNNAD